MNPHPSIMKNSLKKGFVDKRINIDPDEDQYQYCVTEMGDNPDSIEFKNLVSARSNKAITTTLIKSNMEKIEKARMRKRKISLTGFDVKPIKRKAISLPSKNERLKYSRYRGTLITAAKTMYESNSPFPLNIGVGSYLEANLKHRPYMEDYIKLIDSFHISKVNRDKSLFVLCDGHAGDDVAKIVVERFPDIFYEQIKAIKVEESIEESKSIEDAIIKSFKKMDDELVKYEEVGTTCNIIFMQYEKKKRVVYSANVGDSRSVLVRRKEAIRLSYDHKAIDKAEIDRVKKEGGLFLKKRFYGALAITRALGDYTFKNEGAGLSNIPYIQRIELCKEDLYVIMGSDGIWDVINEEMSHKMVLDNPSISYSPSELAKYFVQRSVVLGSKDNISCIAIKLN